MDVESVTESPRYGISRPSRRPFVQEWFGNVRGDLLAGTVVALALILEAIAFSIIAGVDPAVGPYATFVIDLTESHTWDGSAVAAIDRVVLRFRRRGIAVEVIGLNEASATILTRLATHDEPGALDMAPGH